MIIVHPTTVIRSMAAMIAVYQSASGPYLRKIAAHDVTMRKQVNDTSANFFKNFFNFSMPPASVARGCAGGPHAR